MNYYGIVWWHALEICHFGLCTNLLMNFEFNNLIFSLKSYFRRQLWKHSTYPMTLKIITLLKLLNLVSKYLPHPVSLYLGLTKVLFTLPVFSFCKKITPFMKCILKVNFVFITPEMWLTYLLVLYWIITIFKSVI